MRSVHGKKYDAGCVPCLLYIASGSSMDWARAKAGIPYTYVTELRDTGAYGFLLPPTQIKPTGEEIVAFHVSAAQTIIQNFAV